MLQSIAINEAFGWVWFVFGMGTGAALGMRFARESFLGGYGSWERRLLRLGHISFFGLGLINILFAYSAPRIDLATPWISVASWSLIIGGITMPTCCALAAWRKRTKSLFVIPVVSLLIGALITAWGLVRAAVSQGVQP